MVLINSVGAGNRTRALYKMNKGTYVLSHLPSPQQEVIFIQCSVLFEGLSWKSHRGRYTEAFLSRTLKIFDVGFDFVS